VDIVLEIEPVDRAARMVRHVGNVTVALVHDERLIGRAPIQTVVAEQLSVPLGLRCSDVLTSRRQNWTYEFRRRRRQMLPLAMIEMRQGNIRAVRRIALRKSICAEQERTGANRNRRQKRYKGLVD